MSESTNTAENGVSGVEIVLEHVSKTYPGQKEPAVEDVSLTIPAGEIVVFVGPSGSGKTTTMRIINRLIEPTSGRITIGGQDALSLDPNKLRQNIGYAIQQAGLFPHMTVAQNIAVVPKLLKWDRKRIADRVEELLDTVGLDPTQFADRYPRQLSGGQQQRVGVARALAADPPVLLMDEPFGAVDPITRGLLQDELMQIQAELRKTIVFVTHDFSEAVKLGDKIAVLGARSEVLQYDSPEAILANPANDTVAGFVGQGASLQQLNLLKVRDIEIEQRPTAHEGDSVADFAERIGGDWGVILDSRDRPIRWTDRKHLQGVSSLRSVGLPLGELVSTSSTLQDALEAILAERNASAVVTAARGRYHGVVTIETLIETIRSLREQHEDDPPIAEPAAVSTADTAEASGNGT
ncbi:ATP-binding cassette domain-containing protein [Gordonia sp. (in: high G+C Gram-positive bacteria)]|uniref:ABC transporter ATP-binding protein n=1 Tax=Gordonia sp. (in: high G+C Gram-positive bacteria) TaxID=84139 RepID=UPI001692A247|nr:ATP-binding cassette domain-containing protein [Gordonia sp. (in: high G+C Gram-positive bacteria)]NLG47689.1 ATP-binding cassette domain-containing protein [Gordonia sp. (in: high G+C Gram-positive bacteria)]